jgi:hypothetical protein
MKAWLKGGLIGIGIYLVYAIFIYPILDGYRNIIDYFVMVFVFGLPALILGIVLGFVIGAFVGWIVGLFGSKKEVKNE